MKPNLICRFISPNELVAPSFERGLGYISWLHSKEGKKWLEDMQVKEAQLREICREQGSLTHMPFMYLR